MSRAGILVFADEYDEDQFADLHGPASDVDELEETLRRRCGFEVERLHASDHGQTLHQLVQFIRRFKQAPADIVLVYFSGHGLVEPGSHDLYLACTNTGRGAIPGSAIPAATVRNELAKLPTNTVLFLDCCAAGAITPGAKGSSRDTAELLSRDVPLPKGDETHLVIAAASKFDAAFEEDFSSLLAAADGAAPDHETTDGATPRTSAVFTRYFIEGLRTGDADEDRDGRITVYEAYTWAKRRTIDHGVASGRIQQPSFSGSKITDIVIWEDPDLLLFDKDLRRLLGSEQVEYRHIGYQKLGGFVRGADPVRSDAAVRMLQARWDDLYPALRDYLHAGDETPPAHDEPSAPQAPTPAERAALPPPPAPPDAPTGAAEPLAPPGRLLAWAIDATIAAGPGLVLWGSLHGITRDPATNDSAVLLDGGTVTGAGVTAIAVGVAWFLVAVVLSSARTVRTGRTLGRSLFDGAVVDETTGTPPSWRQVAVRNSWYPLVACLYVGLIVPLSGLRSSGRLWTDEAAGTAVVHVPRLRDLRTEPAPPRRSPAAASTGSRP